MFGNPFLKDEVARELLREDDSRDRQSAGDARSTSPDDETGDGRPSFLDDQRDVDAEIVTGDADLDR